MPLPVWTCHSNHTDKAFYFPIVVVIVVESIFFKTSLQHKVRPHTHTSPAVKAKKRACVYFHVCVCVCVCVVPGLAFSCWSMLPFFVVAVKNWCCRQGVLGQVVANDCCWVLRSQMSIKDEDLKSGRTCGSRGDGVDGEEYSARAVAANLPGGENAGWREKISKSSYGDLRATRIELNLSKESSFKWTYV